MVGSPVVAAFIAHAVFWALLVYGWSTDAISTARAGVILALWMAGAIGLPRVPYAPAHDMFPSFVAVLDIALVFMIFKADVRLT